VDATPRSAPGKHPIRRPLNLCYFQQWLTKLKAIGAAQDAARMERVVNFYARLPRGPASGPKPSGLMERYQARYMGKNPSAMRTLSIRSAP
jgi:hypothetical protein